VLLPLLPLLPLLASVTALIGCTGWARWRRERVIRESVLRQFLKRKLRDNYPALSQKGRRFMVLISCRRKGFAAAQVGTGPPSLGSSHFLKALRRRTQGASFDPMRQRARNQPDPSDSVNTPLANASRNTEQIRMRVMIRAGRCEHFTVSLFELIGTDGSSRSPVGTVDVVKTFALGKKVKVQTLSA
jgi:hypothetical protein